MVDGRTGEAEEVDPARKGGEAEPDLAAVGAAMVLAPEGAAVDVHHLHCKGFGSTADSDGGRAGGGIGIEAHGEGIARLQDTLVGDGEDTALAENAEDIGAALGTDVVVVGHPGGETVETVMLVGDTGDDGAAAGGIMLFAILKHIVAYLALPCEEHGAFMRVEHTTLEVGDCRALGSGEGDDGVGPAAGEAVAERADLGIVGIVGVEAFDGERVRRDGEGAVVDRVEDIDFVELGIALPAECGRGVAVVVETESGWRGQSSMVVTTLRVVQ